MYELFAVNVRVQIADQIAAVDRVNILSSRNQL